jgi:DNA-3-methyladenine glycosylase II
MRILGSMASRASHPRSAAPARRGTAAAYAEATRVLAQREPVIADLIARAGPMRLRRSNMTHFAALVQAIVYQQLAGAAARAIHGRLIAAMDEDVAPERLIALSDETLRGVGLSGAKVLSLRDLAAKVLDGSVELAPRALARQSDEEVTSRLSTVRGIGPWSAQMFMIFQLRRLDVWPVGDYGIRKGYGLGWKMPTPTPRELQSLGEPFKPYRTVLAWYCWRAAELFAGAAESALTA